MQLLPEYEVPYPPSAIGHGLPPEQAELARSIESHLYSMYSAAMALNGAVALFGFAREQGGRDIIREWLFIAARDGAMSLRNYVEALASVRGLIGRIPSWLQAVDVKALKAVESSFREKFPFAEKMRHSVAHPEFYSDPTKNMGLEGDMDAFGIKLEGCANVVLHSNLSDYTFHSSFEGALVHYDVSAETALIVVNLTRQCFSAFDALDPYSHRGQFPRR